MQLPKNKPRRRFLPLSKRDFALIVLGFCIPFAFYVTYLDRHVVSQFEGKRFSLPARVFARPLEIFPQKQLSQKRLLDELHRTNYRKVSKVKQPGQYSLDNNAIEIFTRPFTFWDGKQPEVLARTTFKHNRVDTIVNQHSGKPENLIRLEPITIGGIYPGQGEDRQLVRLSEVPESLVNALIATEDKRFYLHHGVDPKAVLRAISSIFSGDRIQGGSTLTQQLVKNFFLTQERTIQRKLKEMVMAILLELHYEKDDILETYLNEVYFGQDKNRAIHGFGLASHFYFSRPVQHIEVHQAALLVGLLKGPTYYNPRKYPERAEKRRNIVLKAMKNQGYIDDAALTKALSQTIGTSAMPNIGQSLYPAFMDLVLRQLKRDYKEADLRSEGLRIFTTVDPFEQNTAEQALRSQLKKLENAKELDKNHLEGALVIVNILDGEVRAVVGGRNTTYQGFNRALDASRQIGSLIKPAIYLTALVKDDEFNLTSVLDDSPFIWREPGIEDWRPQNYDRKFHGKVPMWLALAKSYNVAAARLGTELGVENIISTVKQLGVQKKIPNFASGLLGTMHLTPYEVAKMYHTIAAGGFRTPFRAIREVTTMDGLPLKRYDLTVTPAIPATANYLITKGLQEVIDKGTGSGLRHYLDKDIAIAGKTGTTDDLRDSWFAGFTGDKVAVVWIGNDNNKSTRLTGATGALAVWGDMMRKQSVRPVDMPMPENVRLASVDKLTGFLAVENCRQTYELPFAIASLPKDGNYCSGKPPGKIKSWLKRLFKKGDR